MKQKREARHNYSWERSSLRRAIDHAKITAQKKLLDELDEDTWGKGYQVVTRKFKTKTTAHMSDPQDTTDWAMLDNGRGLYPTGYNNGAD